MGWSIETDLHYMEFHVSEEGEENTTPISPIGSPSQNATLGISTLCEPAKRGPKFPQTFSGTSLNLFLSQDETRQRVSISEPSLKIEPLSEAEAATLPTHWARVAV